MINIPIERSSPSESSDFDPYTTDQQVLLSNGNTEIFRLPTEYLLCLTRGDPDEILSLSRNKDLRDASKADDIVDQVQKQVCTDTSKS